MELTISSVGQVFFSEVQKQCPGFKSDFDALYSYLFRVGQAKLGILNPQERLYSSINQFIEPHFNQFNWKTLPVTGACKDQLTISAFPIRRVKIAAEIPLTFVVDFTCKTASGNRDFCFNIDHPFNAKSLKCSFSTGCSNRKIKVPDFLEL